jgi:hypothetical protein
VVFPAEFIVLMDSAFLLAQYGLQGSITQIGVVTSGVPTSIQRQILATHKEPFYFCSPEFKVRSSEAEVNGVGRGK